MPADSTSGPNVVVVYTDDQDPERVGCYDGRIPTPNVDRLAEEGMRFTNYYTSSAICAPSRYSALTGRYASRNERLRQVSPPDGPVTVTNDAGICGEPFSVAAELSRRGYTTGSVGKWHQGLADSPDDDGDVVVDVPAGADSTDETVAETVSENYRAVREAVRRCGFDEARSMYRANPDGEAGIPSEMYHHNMDWVTQGALDFLDEHGSETEPFFLYVAPTLTHGPWGLDQLATDPKSTPAGRLDEPPDVQPSRESVVERTRATGLLDGRRGHGYEVGANVVWLDDGVGAILDKLDELGIAEETLVVFTSDHGDVKGKGTCYDGGTRQPFIVRWPGVVEPDTTCEELVSNIDIAPTIFDLVDAELPDEYGVDGRSLRPLLTGENPEWRESLYLEVYFERAVVTRDGFKYIATRFPESVGEDVEDGTRRSHDGTELSPFESGPWYADVNYPHYFDRDQLYDLENDPEELRTLADNPEYARRLEKMKDILSEYCSEFDYGFGEFA